MRRPRSRRRRASTARCLRRSTPSSSAGSRRIRRSAIARAASWSRPQVGVLPRAPARPSGWRRRRRPRPRAARRSTPSRHPRGARRDCRRCSPLSGPRRALLAGAVDRVGRGGSPPTTVVRTATVAGEPLVRTVTVEAQPGNRRRRAGECAARRRSAPSSGAALNDQGFRLLRSGNAAAALPILERAVGALQGSGSLAEAYASYNLALARFSTGDCNGVKELLHRSEQIQGKRVGDQAARARRRQGLQATDAAARPQTGFGRRRRVSGGVAVRAPHLQLALRSFVLGAFAFLLRELDDGAELPVAFVEHEHAGGPALYEYRPLVRAFVEERASAAPRARRCADRARGAAARACRRDLRPRPCRAAPVGGRGALPHRAARPARLDRGGVRRLRLGRRLVRSRLRRARALALRRAPHLCGGRSARRHLGADAARARAGAADARGGRRGARAPLARGELDGAEGLRPRDRPLLRARASRRARRRGGSAGRARPRSPTPSARSGLRPPRRSRQVRSSSRRSTAVRSGSGPCCRSQRRSLRARRPGSTRSAARSPASCSCGSASPTPTTRSPRRSTAGSCRCSRTSPSAPSSCAPRFVALLGETWPLRAAVLLETEPDARSALHAELTALAGGDACTRRGGGCRPPCARRGAAARRPACAPAGARRGLARRARAAPAPSSPDPCRGSPVVRPTCADRHEVGTETAQTRHTFPSSLRPWKRHAE